MCSTPSPALDGALIVHSVVGFGVRQTVLLLVQQDRRLLWQTVLKFCESQFDFGVFAVRGLRRLVHAGCHEGVLVLLAGDLCDTDTCHLLE